MKEQKLLLFQQKLEMNQQRTTNSSAYYKQTVEIQNQEKAMKVAEHISNMAERNQSSDYNTKAIATRLQSIAQKRIQTANRQRAKLEGDLQEPQRATQQIHVGADSDSRPYLNSQGHNTPQIYQTNTGLTSNLNRFNSQLTQMTDMMAGLTKVPSNPSRFNMNLQTLKASTNNDSNTNLYQIH